MWKIVNVFQHVSSSFKSSKNNSKQNECDSRIWKLEKSHTHTQPAKQIKEKNNKLWCCANSAIELVDTVKHTKKKHNTTTTKKNKHNYRRQLSKWSWKYFYKAKRKIGRRHKSRSD